MSKPGQLIAVGLGIMTVASVFSAFAAAGVASPWKDPLFLALFAVALLGLAILLIGLGVWLWRRGTQGDSPPPEVNPPHPVVMRQLEELSAMQKAFDEKLTAHIEKEQG